MAEAPTLTRFTLTVDAGVAELTLAVPEELNRMPPAFWEELPAALEALEARGDVRVLIIASTGKHFTAGMDVSAFDGSGATPTDRGHAGEQSRRHLLKLQDVFSRLERARFPVIAATQGGCVGGGVDLIAACDMRYCRADAFFVIQEINIGLAADVGTLQRLPKLIPAGLMRELAYTGRRIFAEEAKASGLVNAVFEDQETLLSEVRRIARGIAEKSPLAIHSSKEIMNYARDHTLEDALRYQAVWMGALTQGGELAEAFRAQKAGEAPSFKDLPPLEAQGK